MKITTIGRGVIGGTLARLWTAAGHEVNELGRAGGDAAGSDVILIAVPYSAVEEALTRVTGLGEKVILDATNRLRGEAPPAGYGSVTEYVKATTNGHVAKAFNLNFGKLLDQAGDASSPPGNIWVGDQDARVAVEQLTRDIGMQPLYGGSLERAATQEAFGYILVSIVQDAGGLVFYRFAAPQNF